MYKHVLEALEWSLITLPLLILHVDIFMLPTIVYLIYYTKTHKGEMKDKKYILKIFFTNPGLISIIVILLYSILCMYFITDELIRGILTFCCTLLVVVFYIVRYIYYKYFLKLDDTDIIILCCLVYFICFIPYNVLIYNMLSSLYHW